MESVGKLFHLINKLNAPDFEVIATYFGHVNKITIDVYLGGWKAGNGSERIEVDEYNKTIHEAMNELERIHMRKFRDA